MLTYAKPEPQDIDFMQIALQEARTGLKEGGIPIGSVMVINGEIVGKGYNRRVQSGNPILHAEMDCLQNAGRLSATDYHKATLYTTLSPCHMCTGAILLYRIPRIVMAENKSFVGAEELLQANNVSLVNLDMPEATKMLQDFIREHPDVWCEDIGI